MSIYSIRDVQRDWSDIADGEGTQRLIAKCTFVDLEKKIQRKVKSYRTQIHAGRAAGLDTSAFKQYAETAPIGDLLAHAYFAKAEQAQRIGNMRAENMIKEATAYADSFFQKVLTT